MVGGPAYRRAISRGLTIQSIRRDSMYFRASREGVARSVELFRLDVAGAYHSHDPSLPAGAARQRVRALVQPVMDEIPGNGLVGGLRRRNIGLAGGIIALFDFGKASPIKRSGQLWIELQGAIVIGDRQIPLG